MNSLQIKSGEKLIDFLKSTKTQSQYKLKEIDLDSQDQWRVQDGILSHTSKGFFQVIGLKNRKNPSDEKLMLYQPQSALTGLILCKINNEVHVLLQARVEPGNTGIIQFGPTIQSTPANYLKLHGGKATAYVESFTSFYSGCHLITHSMQHDLGSKYYQKSKTHHYLEADRTIKTQENMVWASLEAIRDVLWKDNFLNADLRSLLAVFDWDGYWKDKERSQEPTPMPPACSYNLRKYEMCPLTNLTQWRLTEKGIESNGVQVSSIGLYHFSASNREVKAWSQPLFRIQGSGLVQLLYFKMDSKIEFLVQFSHEWGISTEAALYPSYMNLPENPNTEAAFTIGKVRYEVVQCDEGGRFFTNDSVYQVREVDEKTEVARGVWIESDQLILYLKASNVCSFQMRCIASLLLPLLHPDSFGEESK